VKISESIVHEEGPWVEGVIIRSAVCCRVSTNVSLEVMQDERYMEMVRRDAADYVWRVFYGDLYEKVRRMAQILLAPPLGDDGYGLQLAAMEAEEILDYMDGSR
jgi:hypothetical protein